MARDHVLSMTCTACGASFLPKDQTVPMKKTVWFSCPICRRRVPVSVNVTLLADKVEAVA